MKAFTFKALSLYQPWASLVVCGEKRIETRSWGTRFRGPVAIHASRKKDADLVALACSEPFKSALMRHGLDPANLPLGCVLGTVEVVDCLGTETLLEQGDVGFVEKAFGDYSPRRYGFLLARPRLVRPIPCRGGLSFWDLPGDVRAAVEARLEGAA